MEPLKRIIGESNVAVVYGMEEAVFLDAIMFWYRSNRSNAKPMHFHDGRWWTYNSVRVFEDIFPWWNAGQIRRIITRCKDKGALLSGNYNKDQRDRTVWYSPSDDLLALYGEIVKEDCNCGKRQMREPEASPTLDENGEPLPCSTHVRNNTNTPCSPPAGEAVSNEPKSKPRKKRQSKYVPEHRPERFEQFWNYYPGGGSRMRAVAAWDALAPDDALIDEMARALQRQMSSRMWQEGVGIPHASTWLNQRRWTDKLPEEPRSHEGSGSWRDAPEVPV